MKLLNKFFSFLSLFAILFLQISAPLQILAQEASPSTEVIGSPSPTPNATPSETPAPSVEPSPTPTPSLDESLTTPPATQLAIIDTSSTENQSSATLAPPNWQTNPDGSATTTDPVTLNTTYKAPQNDKVTVTFTRLPENPGTITVKEHEVPGTVENAGSKDYEITSNMPNGSFSFNLTLPTNDPNKEVLASQDGQNYEPVTNETVVSSDTVTIKNIIHLTHFIVGTGDGDDYSHPVINEFFVNSTSEWIELYNPTDEEINLNGWVLDDNGASVTTYTFGDVAIGAKSFLVVDDNFGLNDGGDTVRLFNADCCGGTLVESHPYTTDPGSNSIGRVVDGGPDWQEFSVSTKGFSNGTTLNTLYVDNDWFDSDNDGGYYWGFNAFADIQEAINFAPDGATINVEPGTYDGVININKNVNLIGPGIDAEEQAQILSDCDWVLNITSNDVTVQGFYLADDGFSQCYPVVRIDAEISGTTITENEIAGGFRGINFRHDATNNTISDNRIHDNSTGISITDAYGNTISGNEIYNNGDGIILRSDGGGGDLSNNEITANNIHNNDSGIYTGGSGVSFSQLTISDNDIKDNNTYGIYFDGISNGNLTISENIITGNQSTGVYLSGGGNSISGSTVTLSGNTISSNSGDGIYADVITDSTFGLTDNTIESNGNNGIYICAQGKCVNSTVTIDGNGINDNNGTGIYLYEILDGSTMTITENNIQGNGEESLATGIYINYVYNSILDISANDILENIGDGIHIVRITEEGGETLVTISDNEVRENQGYGVYMSEVSNSNVTIGEGNTISNNNNAGIYLNSQVQGVEIIGNIITGNGEVAETTGIVVLSASGNEAHENTISGNGSVGVNNEDDENEFDARKNYWRTASGPMHETTNPEGQGDSVSDNVLYRPFYTDEERTTLSTSSVNPEDLATLLETGTFSISDDEDEVSVNEGVTISVADGGGTSSVTLPAGTTITRTDGEDIDVSELTTDDVTESSLTGLGTGVVVDGALQWGLDNIELNFNPAITLSIFVGSAFNGQTLNIQRSTSGTGSWTNEGIGPPTTCFVAGGLCTFQATKASYYATTHTASTTSTSGTTQATTTPTGPFTAPSCNDQRPGSAPTLVNTSTGTNSVTLNWNKALDPVTYYLITYGLSSGTQQYGHPNVGGRDTTSYTVLGLSGGTTYYFKVRAGNGCAPGDFSNELSATPGGGFVEGPAAGFAPGVLGVASEEVSPSAEVKGESATSEGQPSATIEPQTAEQSPFNVKLILIIVVALLLGFGVFKLIIK